MIYRLLLVLSVFALWCCMPPMLYTLITKKEIKGFKIWRVLGRYRLDCIENKNKKPFGFAMFVGKQGSGKTYSAVQYALDICNKHGALLVSNTPLNVPANINYIHIKDISQLYYLPSAPCYVYLLDEIQTLFDIHNFDQSFYTVFCQLRKRNIKIISTCQVFARCALPLREQVQELYGCHTYLGCLTRATRYSANLTNDGKLCRKDVMRLGSKWYIQSEETRKVYDTYFKI